MCSVIILSRRNTEITPSPQTPAKVDAFHTKVVATFSSPENDFNYKEEMKETEVTSETLKTVVIVQEDFDVQPHPPPHEKVLTVVPVYVDYDGVIYAQDHAEGKFYILIFKYLNIKFKNYI